MGFWSRSGKSQRKSKAVKQARKIQPTVETLERRDLLTGFWTPLVNPVPNGDGATTSILLSDGTVMVQGGGGFASNTWYALTPDSTGSYQNGTWSQLATSNLERLFAPISILPDGRLFIVGGEYSGPNSDPNFDNSAEIYNPVTDQWTAAATFPQSIFGDDPTQVLPNGQVLAGFIGDARTYFYDPATDQWTQAATKLNSDRSDEESWVKLPDDSILSYNIFSSIATGVSTAQRYIPSLNQWVPAGTLTDGSGQPLQMSSNAVGDELGPAMLLPDGRVLQFGATGLTAYYTPSTDTWVQGPSIPDSLIAADDAGAVLPNGKLLITVAPFGTNSTGGFGFPSPTSIFEFDPIANTYTDVTPTDDNLDQEGSFQTTMLDLPSGQVLLTNDTGQLEVYTPDGAPQASWAPTITSIQRSGTTFTLTGTQLNGLDEGASYGDDLEMSSNYPLVRLTNISTGQVSYARTSNWSSVSVQTGSLPVTVNFTFPAADAPGTYLLEAVANGIASTPRLVVFGSPNGDTVDITATSVKFKGVTSAYTASAISGIDVFAGNGSNTINVLSTPAGLPVNLQGGTGADQFNFGSAGTVSGIVSPITVDGTAGVDKLTINDNADATPRTITINATQIATAPGDNLFGPGGSLSFANVGNLVVNGGTGGNHINVLGAANGGSVSVAPGTGTNSVFVGFNGSGAGNLQNILGTVTVTGQGVATALNIDGSSSTTSNTLTLSDKSVSSAANNFFGAGGSVVYSALTSLVVSDGSGGNQIQVLATASGTTTTINSGDGDDNFLIDSTPGSPTGDVNGILSSLILDGQGGNNALLVEDRNDAASKSFTINSSQIGAASGDNLFGAGGNLAYFSIGSLSLNGSSGGNTITVQSTPAGPFHLFSGDGSDSIFLGSGGANSTLDGIVGTLIIDGGAGQNNSLTLDDRGSSTPNIVTLTPTTVGADPGDSFLPSGASVSYANFQNLTVNTSNAGQGDAIDVFPSATTTMFVNAGNPTPPATPGDALTINLVGITGATLNPTGLGTGFWSYTNAKSTFFTGIEKQGNLNGLGGVVFQDVNGNGSQDAGDAGIAGLTVTLFDANDNQVDQEATAADGSFQFFVGVGTYHVMETLPSGVIQTTPPPPAQTVILGQPNVNNLNFGNFTLTSISGQVFQDANGNGALDSGEPALVGWKVDLEDINGIVERTATTDANGAFSFPNLLPGAYRIREEVQTGWLQTTSNPADIVSASGVNQASVNFGNFQVITLGGEVFNDLTGNGILDGNDNGLSGWIVDLDRNGSLLTTATSDSNGNYSFPNLAPGTYRIRVEGQTNWVTTNAPADITAQSGQNQPSVDLGLFQQFNLKGEVYLDANANGALDSGETGLSGWTVYLDTNGNGSQDPNEPTTVTDANGDYIFANLGPGVYKVREVVQPGWKQVSSTPADIIGQSGLDQNADFGNFQVATISGQVFNDLNGTGSKDSGDTGLAGWTVFLDTNGNGKLDPGELSTTSDSNGNFSFPVDFAGTARLTEVVQSGWVQTTTQSLIALHTGLVFSEDIGNFQTVSITSQVYVDTNGNGTSDGGTEPGRNGVQISLYSDVDKNGIFNASVDTLVSATTSAPVGSKSGIYSFTGLTPGAYFLVETPIAGIKQSGPAAPGYYSITVQSGMDITGKDFGNLAGVTQSYLFALYQQLFGRHIDPAGLQYWSVVLNLGVSRQLVVHQLGASLEGHTKVVNDIFQAYLGRKADPQALAFGIKLLSTEPPPANFTPQQLLKELVLGSSEFFNTQAGKSNAQFITTMYHDVTGVNPTTAQTNALLAELSGGTDRGTLASQVLRSEPGYDFVVQNYYQKFLGRSADSRGLAFFVGILELGAREEEVQQGLLGSDEFFGSL